MQHAAHPFPPSLLDHCTRVGFSIARVDHHGKIETPGQRQLLSEGTPLKITRRIVVVVIQTAFTNGDRTLGQQLRQCVDVAGRIKIRRIVRMHARRVCDEARIRRSDPGRFASLLDGSADADNCHRARIAGACDYRAAVTGEGRVCEVGVAVDEVFFHAALTRGYLRSIQMSTGPAT